MYTQRGRMPLSQSRLYWYLETFCKEVIKDHDEENTLDNGLSGLMDLYLILTTCTKKKRLSGVKHTRKKGGGGWGWERGQQTLLVPLPPRAYLQPDIDQFYLNIKNLMLFDSRYGTRSAEP